MAAKREKNENESSEYYLETDDCYDNSCVDIEEDGVEEGGDDKDKHSEFPHSTSFTSNQWPRSYKYYYHYYYYFFFFFFPFLFSYMFCLCDYVCMCIYLVCVCVCGNRYTT